MTDNSASLIELEQTSQLLGDDMISIVNCPEKLNAQQYSGDEAGQVGRLCA